MKEALIIAGGIYTVALIIFHVLLWRIFNWPETLTRTTQLIDQQDRRA